MRTPWKWKDDRSRLYRECDWRWRGLRPVSLTSKQIYPRSPILTRFVPHLSLPNIPDLIHLPTEFPCPKLQFLEDYCQKIRTNPFATSKSTPQNDVFTNENIGDVRGCEQKYYLGPFISDLKIHWSVAACIYILAEAKKVPLGPRKLVQNTDPHPWHSRWITKLRNWSTQNSQNAGSKERLSLVI